MRVYVRFVKIGKVWKEASDDLRQQGDKFALRRITNRKLKRRRISGELGMY